MRLNGIAVCLSILVTSLAVSPALAQFCPQLTTDGLPRPLEQSPNIRVVFGSFPAPPSGSSCFAIDPVRNDLIPSWADAFADGFEDYLAWVSNGHFTPTVTVVRHTAQGLYNNNWRAPSPSIAYRNNCTPSDPNALDYGDLNARLVQDIYNDNPNAWTSVDAILFIHFEKPFNYTQSALIGYGSPGWPSTFSPMSVGLGTTAPAGATLMLDCSTSGNDLDDLVPPDRLYRAIAHEFGHNLALGHTANTIMGEVQNCPQAPSSTEFVNLGRYGAIMRQGHPFPVPIADPGLVAYHPMDIGQSLPGSTEWVPVSTIAPCPSYQTIRVAEIRDPDPARGKITKVTVPGSDQYFLLVNHQGGSQDSKYGGTGLLVWHIWPNHAWDLESARGKTIAPPGMSGTPNPNTWWDPLEANVCEMGAAGDFFDGSPGRANFNPTTNPNTNLYATTYQSQTVPSGLHFDNIRYDLGTTDILVDVATSNFGIESPVAGARYAAGEVIKLDWAMCGSMVDVLMSDATGSNSSFTLLEDNGSNDGTFSYTVPASAPAGTNYKFRIIPDNNPNFGVDSSPFAIWTLSNLTATPRVKVAGTLLLDFRWNTSLSPNQDDGIILLPPNSQPPTYTFTRTANGTNHFHTVSVPCQTGTWRYVASSSTSNSALPFGKSTASSFEAYGQTLGEVVVSSCSPPPGPCPPNCEFEQQAHQPGVEPAGVPVFLKAVANPFQTSTALRFGLPRASRVDLVLHDVTGRVVRTLASGEFAAGQHHAHWDGLDDGGRRVPAGLYLAQLRTEEAALTQKLMRVH